MKIRFEYLFTLLFILTLAVAIVAIRFLFPFDWEGSINFVFDILSQGELGNLSGYSFIQKLVIFGVAITGAAIQLGVVVIFVNLVIRLFLRKQEYIEKKMSEFIAEYPIRQIFTLVFLSILFFSVILIRTIERISWLDAVYFTIVTISTVGFGDIQVTHPISKLVVILLIFNGITFIGLASQIIIDRIVNLQLSKQNSLPTAPIPLQNHVIIAGYGSKGRRLSQLFVERGYDVVVVEMDEDRAKLAEINGFRVINSDITKPALLEILSLNDSSGLFLLLSDDNLVIQAGIIARSISEDLDIYGEFLSVPTYNISRYAGINKPISLFVFLTNELQNFFSQSEIETMYSVKDLRLQESSLGFVQVPIHFDYEGIFENPLVIGEVSSGLNEIYLDSHLAIEYEKPPVYSTHLLIAVDREELDSKLKGVDRQVSGVDRLIFAGYSELVDSLIDRLDVPEEDIIVLWHKPEYQEILQQKPYKHYQWSLENGHLLLEQLVKEDDLVICTFEDITSSLIVGVTLNNLKKSNGDAKAKIENVQLIQFVPYEYDIEPLMKVGAEVVYTPQQIISSAILSIFLKENNLSPSVVYTNGHLYEHLVIPDDFFHNKTVMELENFKYNVLYVRENDDDEFHKEKLEYKLQAGDRVLMFIKNKQKERLDRLEPVKPRKRL